MDGRTQEKALAYAKQLFGTDYVDMITEPGMDGLLAGSHSVVETDEILSRVEWIRAKADISANGHGSSQVVIFGHCGCAGNQVDINGHKEHLAKAKEAVQQWGLFKDVRTALFNEEFEIEPLD